MNKDDIPFKEQQLANCTEDQTYKEKVPWKLGKHLKHNHVEKLNRLVTDHHQRMFHLLNNKGAHAKHDGNI
ncbi:hypothetical protein [Ectobacillus panaciterrae]|uniref:hypothetical protein n=1 Tax=Ectobacillus panaciterrae TaxID=363872 RepID=UPI0003F623C2|nr:hypothetical protein [Ectobacillus panaciterrae]